MPIISIYGKARSGKSTASSYLVMKYGLKRLSFGSRLKKYYHEIFGVTGEGKDREGYQWFGQLMRSRDPDVWVKQVDASLSSYLQNEYSVVFDDMRQPNEYKYLKQLGAIMIRIDSPLDIRLERMVHAGDIISDTRVLNHETESYLDDFEPDYVITNSGDPNSLYYQLGKIIREMEMKDQSISWNE
ncbi:Dephospho-CoA kinase [Thermoactinomyces sp. DSM 45891]|uniref:AAA family ATPase n=1 Tax=Thermoactinomyces sp. DSM 45891 TaxID=1761907 RepID=UPI00091648C7|nr:hypothetical protein [Thermoactinomyces sp. DSM 45891]SFX47767.1 Dephospho-CoA kinase [Thermoactinomyces sp. DSM 45891]